MHVFLGILAFSCYISWGRGSDTERYAQRSVSPGTAERWRERAENVGECQGQGHKVVVPQCVVDCLFRSLPLLDLLVFSCLIKINFLCVGVPTLYRIVKKNNCRDCISEMDK